VLKNVPEAEALARLLELIESDQASRESSCLFC
jgi:hypothetical protein